MIEPGRHVYVRRINFHGNTKTGDFVLRSMIRQDEGGLLSLHNIKESERQLRLLGYIKNIDGVVKELGGDIIEKIIMKNIDNPLNPTVCYVINPPRLHETSNCIIEARKIFYSVPGANFQLKRQGNFYFSNQAGLFYPILKGIPILKTNNAILASALTDLTS